jgi:hypothetical protein
MIEHGAFGDAAAGGDEISRANDPENVNATGVETASRRPTAT